MPRPTPPPPRAVAIASHNDRVGERLLNWWLWGRDEQVLEIEPVNMGRVHRLRKKSQAAKTMVP